MSTRYAEIFRKLQAPFDRRDLKTFSKGGKNFAYITARHAMIRLDMVVGPESWKDEYFETKEGLKCRLSIRFGDEWVGKEDGGGAAGMSDHDDDEKSAFSSAFKRAAVKWGIARELYGDGVATFDVPLPSAAAPAPRQAAPPPPTANGHAPADGAPRPAPKLDHRPLARFIADGVEHHVGKFRERHPDAKPPVNSLDASRHIIAFAVAKGYVPEQGAPNEAQIAKLLAGLTGFDEVRKPLQDEAAAYLKREVDKAEERLRLEEQGDPDLDEAAARR
jgi:hypothetical protein